jgi:hypothetical protein
VTPTTDKDTEDSHPKILDRLKVAAQRLEQIKAITSEEHAILRQDIRKGNIKSMAQNLVIMLKGYNDETRMQPDSRFPTLKRGTFRPKIFEILAEQHLDNEVRSYIRSGFEVGFPTMWEGQKLGKRVATNPSMTEEGEAAVLTTVLKDWGAGVIAQVQLWGDDDYMENMVISPTYAIQKRSCGQPLAGKFRRVFNLSRRFQRKRNRKRTRLNSVNDDIDPEACKCLFAKLTDAIDIIKRKKAAGEDVFLAKADIKDAFLCLPIMSEELHLMCFSWVIDFEAPGFILPEGVEPMKGKQEVVFVNSRFPFGLRSAPRIFELLAQTIRQIASYMFNVQLSVSYLDDIIIMQTSKEACEDDLAIYLAVLQMLGLEPQMEKVSSEASTQCDFLGLDIDTEKEEVRMPQKRMEMMLAIIEEWIGKKSCTRVELERLIGSLTHMTKGVPAGKLFMRRMIDTLWSKECPRADQATIPLGCDDIQGDTHEMYGRQQTMEEIEAAMSKKFETLAPKALKQKQRYKRKAQQQLILSEEFHLDLQWWRANARTFNHHGFPFMTDAMPSFTCELETASDASDQGHGAYHGGAWYACRWEEGEKDKFPIFYRELYAVIRAISTWGDQWKGQVIHFYCDSTNAILAAKKATSKNKSMMHLLRHLHTLCVDFQCHVYFEYINTKKNAKADALSKLNIVKFRNLHPTAYALPSPLLRPMPRHPDVYE